MTPAWICLICLAWLFLIPCLGNAVAPMIAAGYEHSLALTKNGKFVAWDSDVEGQLGIGRPLHSATRFPVAATDRFDKIAPGAYQSLAPIVSSS